MDKLLQSLDQFKDLPIVKIFAGLFSERSLAPLIAKYKDRVVENSGGLARELLLWAILLALVVFLVDQAFYWSKPGRLYEARESWLAFAQGTRNAFRRVKGFVGSLASGGRRGYGRK